MKRSLISDPEIEFLISIPDEPPWVEHNRLRLIIREVVLRAHKYKIVTHLGWDNFKHFGDHAFRGMSSSDYSRPNFLEYYLYVDLNSEGQPYQSFVIIDSIPLDVAIEKYGSAFIDSVLDIKFKHPHNYLPIRCTT